MGALAPYLGSIVGYSYSRLLARRRRRDLKPTRCVGPKRIHYCWFDVFFFFFFFFSQHFHVGTTSWFIEFRGKHHAPRSSPWARTNCSWVATVCTSPLMWRAKSLLVRRWRRINVVEAVGCSKRFNFWEVKFSTVPNFANFYCRCYSWSQLGPTAIFFQDMRCIDHLYKIHIPGIFGILPSKEARPRKAHPLLFGDVGPCFSGCKPEKKLETSFSFIFPHIFFRYNGFQSFCQIFPHHLSFFTWICWRWNMASFSTFVKPWFWDDKWLPFSRFLDSKSRLQPEPSFPQPGVESRELPGLLAHGRSLGSLGSRQAWTKKTYHRHI